MKLVVSCVCVFVSCPAAAVAVLTRRDELCGSQVSEVSCGYGIRGKAKVAIAAAAPTTKTETKRTTMSGNCN